MSTSITDPLYAQQWHLRSLGGNIEEIWKDYTGKNVHTGVYDDGLDTKHADLSAGYDASREVTINGRLADPLTGVAVHGTMVAGLIAGQLNGIGGVGVSYGASITGVNVFTGPASGAKLIDAAKHMQDFDSVNMSWGWSAKYADDVSKKGEFGTEFAAALETAANSGRDGKGTVLVNSSGNGWVISHQDSNFQEMSQSRYTITVGAIAQDGNVTSYSSRGASLLVSAPSSEGKVTLTTTDRMGRSGSEPGDYTKYFGGTSGAAPIVTGVVNLMLDANANLGWRDVQSIIAITADATGTASLSGGASGRMAFGWTNNGAENVNGGGMHFSNDVGFGRIDAYEAVRFAEVWSNFGESQTSANEKHVSVAGVKNMAISGTNGAEFTFTVDETISIEHVDLTLVLTHQMLSELQIELTSPDGTVTILQDAGGTGISGSNFSWIFGSEALRGELTKGEWTVRIVDVNGGPVGSVKDFVFDAYGTTPSADDLYHYTSDYAKALAVDSSRSVLTDRDGGTDWINAAGLVTNTVVDLREGGLSKFGGASVTIAQGTVIENAVTGDGNDSLRGNASSNTLMGMRGNDLLEGGGGADTIDGGNGVDTATYVSSTLGVDVRLDRATQVGGDAEGDRLISIESVVGSKFADILTGNAQANDLSGEDGDDMLVGLYGDDRLFGGQGNDVLNGSQGNDVLTGGAGSDTFVFDLPQFGADTIVDFARNIDKIDLRGSGLSYASLAFEWMASNLVLSLIGGTVGNTIKILNLGGPLSITDFIFSPQAEPEEPPAVPEEEPPVTPPKDEGEPAGSDPTPPEEPASEPDTGSSPPTGTTDPKTPAEGTGGSGSSPGVKNTTSGTDYVLRAGDLNLTLINAAVVGTGNALANKIVGNASANILTGGAGDDALYGNAGADLLRGDAGNDKLFGGDGSDTLEGGVGKDYLDGGTGADTSRGGAGADTYIVDHLADVVDEVAGQSADDGSVDSVTSSVDFTLGRFVENLSLTGAAIKGTGNEIDNKIVGNTLGNTLIGNDGDDGLHGDDGNDTLNGGNGDDTLNGGTGTDILDGGAGKDALDGGTGADIMRGGAGADKYTVDHVGDVVDEAYGQAADDDSVDLVTSSVDYALGAFVENLTLAGKAVVGTGNELANKIVGTAAANILDGGAGADTLIAGDGNDTLIGGAGKDTLTGGAGADRFVFSWADLDAADKIMDFSTVQRDKVVFNGAEFGLSVGSGATAGNSLASDYFQIGTVATSGHAQFLFDSKTKVLSYDADGHAGDAIAIATLSGAATLSNADFFII